ncbi:hypothetical protein SEVIR_3G339500v4 [Setaria viridis]|uniref:Metallothionein-like protein n=2 Tax=Setaria TaxID=4554 RepID=A0A368QNA5_SETIT|nr:hypothetical protein SETIT_3G326900v2 [Setaria italica]TKW28620.1 hypothetical protein SEVIR_3G339500v2 [Setaria viridis]
MSCCGGSCSCGSCGCGVMYLGFDENTSNTPGTMVLGVSAEKGAGEVPEKATESGEAGYGYGCSCGSGCSCSPCSC